MPGLPECIPTVKDQSRPTSPPDELQQLTTVTQAPPAVDASQVVEASPEDKPTTQNLQDLAREFGVNPRLIEALAQRLNNQL